MPFLKDAVCFAPTIFHIELLLSMEEFRQALARRCKKLNKEYEKLTFRLCLWKDVATCGISIATYKKVCGYLTKGSRDGEVD